MKIFSVDDLKVAKPVAKRYMRVKLMKVTPAIRTNGPKVYRFHLSDDLDGQFIRTAGIVTKHGVDIARAFAEKRFKVLKVDHPPLSNDAKYEYLSSGRPKGADFEVGTRDRRVLLDAHPIPGAKGDQ